MNLQSNWFKSDDISELAEALASFQANAPEIPRNKTVKVRTKSGGTYTFDYAPLDVVFDSVRGELEEHGLAVTQLVGDGVSVTTVLMHQSGQYIGATFDFKDNISYDEDQNSPFKDMQDVGSAVTYAKRYGLEAILGVVAQDDDDANKASGNSIESSKSKSSSSKSSKKKSKKSKSKKSKSKSKDKDEGELSYEELKEKAEELDDDEFMDVALGADPDEVIDKAEQEVESGDLTGENNDFFILFYQAHANEDGADFKDKYQERALEVINNCD